MPLVRPFIPVEHDHAVIAVAVGHEHFVGRWIDFDIGRAAEVRGVVAALALALVPDLQQKLPVSCELQDLRILCVVATGPDVTSVIDVESVLRQRPLVTGARAPEVPQEVARLIELENLWRRYATFAGWRLRCRAFFGGCEGRRPVKYPDMVIGIGRQADDRTHNPVIRQWFRPHRIDLEGAWAWPVRATTAFSSATYANPSTTRTVKLVANAEILRRCISSSSSARFPLIVWTVRYTNAHRPASRVPKA